MPFSSFDLHYSDCVTTQINSVLAEILILVVSFRFLFFVKVIFTFPFDFIKVMLILCHFDFSFITAFINFGVTWHLIITFTFILTIL